MPRPYFLLNLTVNLATVSAANANTLARGFVAFIFFIIFLFFFRFGGREKENEKEQG